MKRSQICNKQKNEKNAGNHLRRKSKRRKFILKKRRFALVKNLCENAKKNLRFLQSFALRVGRGSLTGVHEPLGGA